MDKAKKVLSPRGKYTMIARTDWGYDEREKDNLGEGWF